MLYHATYVAYLPSIMKLGLGAVQKKNWCFSKHGTVYLCTDPFMAISFCEAAEEVKNEVYDSGIVLLSIDESRLTLPLISDENIKDGSYTCFEYHGVIPAEFLRIAPEPSF